jgi:predicted nucleic acid-binding Zn ribbon protein
MEEDPRLYIEVHKCISCGKSLDVDQSVGRPQNGGCIPAMAYECKPCAQKSDALREALAYQEKHFCSLCRERFKRPYFRNRKQVAIDTHCGDELNSYCIRCYEITKVEISGKDHCD